MSDPVYAQSNESRPRTPSRSRGQETLSNRLTRIRRRAGVLLYTPDKDPASMAREPDRELLEHCRVTGQQIGALWAARHRGLL